MMDKYIVVGKSPFWKTLRFIDVSDPRALVWRRSRKLASPMTLSDAQSVAKQVTGGPNKFEVEVVRG